MRGGCVTSCVCINSRVCAYRQLCAWVLSKWVGVYSKWVCKLSVCATKDGYKCVCAGRIGSVLNELVCVTVVYEVVQMCSVLVWVCAHE